MRLRVVPLLAVAVAVVLAALAAASVVGGREREEAARDRLLSDAAQAEVAAVEGYFARARDIVLLTAHNPAFGGFYREPGSRAEKIADPDRTIEARRALAYLEQLYEGAIGEACFIDAGGAENARVVRGTHAAPADLSPDETTAVFFAPTMALPAGGVYQAEPYRSPDTDEWVISNSTPLVDDAGAKLGIVHYEVTLDSFRREFERVAGPQIAVEIVDADGVVLLRSGEAKTVGSTLAEPDPAGVGRAALAAGGEPATVGGRRQVVRRVGGAVPDGSTNANAWAVVVSSPAPAALSLAGLGVEAIALALAALAMLGVAIVAAWRGRLAARRELERALDARRVAEERSRTDLLTGLANRRACIERLTEELRRAEREGHVPGVLVVDADRFKRVNDTYGHAAGDAVLVEVSRRLRRAVREYDTVARWGGEEFCIVVPRMESDDDLVAVAEALRAAVAASPVAVGGELLLPVTVSIGGVRAAESLWSVEGIVDAADRALYSAKRRGRDRVRLFTDMSVEDFVAEEPEALRLAQVLALSAAIREGMPELHSQQVAELAAATAVELGLAEDAVLRCRLGGWLHDVGKIAIPDRILAKPGALDDAEWEIMRTHPAVGEELVARVAGLADAARAVRGHHERYDGSGYPDGLAGADIPIEARVVAVADAYSAITSDRPYQRGRGFDAAICELRDSAGTHLDPAVVEAAVRALVSREQAIAGHFRERDG